MKLKHPNQSSSSVGSQRSQSSQQLATIVIKQQDAKSKKKQQQFGREIRLMMYGFGDDPNPRPDSVDLMEDLVMSYVHDLCAAASRASRKRGVVKIEDFLFSLRKDPKKLARAEELLFRFDELLKARKAFDTSA